MLSETLRSGDVLAGKYRVEKVIGRGGLGVVVAATHLALDRVVALKFLLPGYDTAPAALERFIREARAAAKLKSDHVVQVLDADVLENGTPYIAMEYLDGVDLSRLTEGRRLPLSEAVDYVLQACEAVAEAHAAGIVHRDLKPANLFRTTLADGSSHIKVLDFGIAKMSAAAAGSDHALTSTRGIMGSPLYMSPEQLESARDVDARSDIWSLGAILYELVTGRPPFVEETLARLCVTILQQEPKPPSALAPELPVAFDAVVMRCLRKRRSDRFASVVELSRALAAFAPPHSAETLRRLERLGQSRLGQSQPASAAIDPAPLATTLRSDAPPASGAQTADKSSWGRTHSTSIPRGLRRALLIVAALASVGLVGLTIAFVAVSRNSATPAAPLTSAALVAPPASAQVSVAEPSVTPAQVASVPASSARPAVKAAPIAARPRSDAGSKPPRVDLMRDRE